jgi:hypothetical protein
MAWAREGGASTPAPTAWPAVFGRVLPVSRTFRAAGTSPIGGCLVSSHLVASCDSLSTVRCGLAVGRSACPARPVAALLEGRGGSLLVLLLRMLFDRIADRPASRRSKLGRALDAARSKFPARQSARCRRPDRTPSFGASASAWRSTRTTGRMQMVADPSRGRLSARIAASRRSIGNLMTLPMMPSHWPDKSRCDHYHSHLGSHVCRITHPSIHLSSGRGERFNGEGSTTRLFSWTSARLPVGGLNAGEIGG